ncbi:hypothetical protein [Hymenobacter cellulosilyticus]|uniref:Uncharacterized protein n=1 Tax=Hymenobacter cellulosilyticus TaxID=2932248 RepID=A0A8T9PYD4_9BACT|nr:hypothetical protein [Hymenobacter cellulosilyticus]UOQ70077.1 hypothetical protein MUN79_14975 [Hymenobacter cellulosilyticus]
MPIPYRTLYFLDNATTSILEVKRLDLPADQAPTCSTTGCFSTKPPAPSPSSNSCR